MGTVYRKVTVRPVPAGATTTRHADGTASVRWTPRGARRPTTAKVVTLKDGRQVVEVPTGNYYAKYRDGDGIVRVVSTGCKSEDAARQVLATLERQSERIRAKVVTREEVRRAAHLSTDLDGHIADYTSTLTGSRTHRADTERYLRRLAADCRWTTLADLRRDDLDLWLAAETGKGRSARSRNGFQVAACSFCNWLVDVGRLTTNPFTKMAKANLDADRRRPRRALTPDEVERLLQAAVDAPERPALKPAEGDDQRAARPRQRLCGADRAILYRVLVGTGLRVGEVKQLRVSDLRLDGPVPTVALSAGTTKNRRSATLPLRSDLAQTLRRYVAGRSPSSPVFDVPADLIRRFHADCKRAGIARYDDADRQVDLHSLRLTFGAWLAASGVPPRTAQELMRHQDVNLTMKVYTDPRLLDLAGAVEGLPAVRGTGSTKSSTQSSTDKRLA